MVPNAALINALRKLGYRHKRQTERVHLYKKPGDTRRVPVNKNAYPAPEYATFILRQAGMSDDDIKRFLSSVNH